VEADSAEQAIALSETMAEDEDSIEYEETTLGTNGIEKLFLDGAQVLSDCAASKKRIRDAANLIVHHCADLAWAEHDVKVAIVETVIENQIQLARKIT
jgi:hypothetical protein